MQNQIQEQINQINAAISAIENGAQEYTINGRRFVRANISALYSERKALNSQLVAEQNNGIGMNTFVAKFDRR
nr:MAG TPA: hypothetical protein [Bacteriophage sp.]